MNRISTAFLFLLTSLSSSFAAGLEVLAPHRAVYEVSLAEAQERSGIGAMEGRIVYEMTGNACDGITIQYRFVTRIQAGRETFMTDEQSASHESPDGNEFSFSTRSFVNDQPDQTVAGSAVRTEDGILVTQTGKEPKKFVLPSAMFTTEHLLDVMKRAEEGEAFVTHLVFDGTGRAKVLASASVIGRKKTLAERLEGESEQAVEKLLDQEAWPITMSYFNTDTDNTAEATPVYEASFLLYENGVTRDLTMSYPDYELKAVLQKIEFLDQPSCG